MKAVLDTNVAVSGLLYTGNPQLLLQQARRGSIQLFTSRALLLELCEVVERRKFARRIDLLQTTPPAVVIAYLAIADIVLVDEAERVVARDRDDDEVIACAVAADADCIITGDHHLLEMSGYREIHIITVSEALARIHGSSAE